MDLKTLSILLFSVCALSGADCDIKFTLKASSLPVIYNNKTSACYNWQFTYFGSGLSAATVTVATAPDAGNTPGTFTTFAATTGSNPATAITQATALFTGSFAWLKITGTLTGSGQISGRLLGVQATSAAVGFPSSGNNIWGNPIAPLFSDFSWVDQGSATGANSAIAPNGVILVIPQGGNSNVRRKSCQSLHAAPFTVEVGLITEKMPDGFQQYGFTLRNSGSGKEELFATTAGFISNLSPWTVYQCNSNIDSSCSDVAAGFSWIPSGPWAYARVIDTGAVRGYDVSLDGVNWWRSTSRFGTDDPGPSYAFSTYDQVCMHVFTSSNSGPFHGRFFHWKVI